MRFDFNNVDRRLIYLVVLLALCVPLVAQYSVKPARMVDAERVYESVERFEPRPGDYAFVALDMGPSTVAENGPQADVVVEHLMRRRVPIIFFSLYFLSEPFLKSIPEKAAARLAREHPGESWEYGRDWINLGYRPGMQLIIQAIPKSDNLAALFETDAYGNKLVDLPGFAGLRTLKQIRFLFEVTGLVGMLDTYIRFFKSRDYSPVFCHGCTSITIPEAFIYLDSGQIKGLLGGIAGAAWYSELLSAHYPNRVRDASVIINTSLGVAHLVVIAFIVLGNLAALGGKRT